MANMPGRCSLRLPATSRQPGANPRRSAQRAPATAAVAARQLTDGSRRLSPCMAAEGSPRYGCCSPVLARNPSRLAGIIVSAGQKPV
jgi:hypothetical protein